MHEEITESNTGEICQDRGGVGARLRSLFRRECKSLKGIKPGEWLFICVLEKLASENVEDCHGGGETGTGSPAGAVAGAVAGKETTEWETGDKGGH